MNATLAQCQVFLAVIFQSDDIIEFRPVKGGKSRWGTLADLHEIIPWLQRLNAERAQVYFGANPRTSRGGSKTKDVILARCLFADFDDGATYEDVMRRITLAGLPAPTVVIQTGGGIHCWWLLAEPVTDLAAWTRRMKRIIAATGADKTIHDAPRVMRLPGFVNHKYAHKPTAEIVEIDEQRIYSWEEMTPRDMARESRDFLLSGTLLPGSKRRETIFTVACDLKARGWSLVDAEAAIMPAAQTLGLESEDVADLPRQIGNAFSQARKPLRDRATGVEFVIEGVDQNQAVQNTLPAGAANVEQRETQTDAGLCKRLCHEGQGRFHWVSDRKTWVRWDGVRWFDDPDGGEPRRVSKAIAASLWSAAGPNASNTLVKFCRDAASRRGIDAAAALAKSEPGVETSAATFDADPYLINCENGILGLKNMILRPHDPAARLTKLAPVRFDPAAECPGWLAFLAEVMLGDEEMVAYLQRSLGLALSGDVSEQILSVHWGDGCNGKSLFFAVLAKIFGDYAAPIPADILVTAAGERDREKSVSRLVGRRLCYAQEPDEGGRLAEGSLKALTGGDRLTARVEWERARVVSPTWHLHVCMNQLPQIRGTDRGLWRRLHIIRWGRTFGPEEQRPRAEIEGELLAEAPGIFRWLCDGFAAWMQGGLRPPEAVLSLTSRYRQFSDSVSRWLASEEVAHEEGFETAAGALYAAYCRFCSEEGCPAVTQAMFGRSLEGRGIKKCRPKAGPWRDTTVRVGLRLAASPVSTGRLASVGA
jgi:putative DNA primase/helicase